MISFQELCLQYGENNLTHTMLIDFIKKREKYLQLCIECKENEISLLNKKAELKQKAYDDHVQKLNSDYDYLYKKWEQFSKCLNMGPEKFISMLDDLKEKLKSNLNYTTVNVSNGIRLDKKNKYIKIPKLNFVKIKLHRQLPANCNIKHITISKTSTNKYYVSICVQYELNIKENQLDINNSIGLDYSSHDFYVDSDGNKADYPKYYRQYQSKVAKEQRKLAKMQKGSSNYKKQKIKVARIHEKISNLRYDFVHKLSTKLANQCDYIFVEDINLQAMSQCLRLGKSTLDNSFGKFRELLNYKMIERNKIFYKIDKWQPTTIVCSSCGSYHKYIVNSLDVREWTCPDCGATHDRDTNAAKNIRKAGIQLILSL